MTALKASPLVLSIAACGLGACSGDSTDGTTDLIAFILVIVAHSGETTSGATTTPLFCEPGFEDNGNPVNVCVYHCAVTADCPNVFTSCQSDEPKICYVNPCGPGAWIVNGTTYYADCNSGGTNNGTCVPYYGTGTPGVCQAAGPVAVWQPCSDLRLDGGISELCAKETTCLVFPVDGGAPKTMCAPLCAPAGASVSGPSCEAGQTCFSAGSVDFGFCLTDCAGGQSCPAPTACQGYGTLARPECLP
jgi:hypothetical protein